MEKWLRSSRSCDAPVERFDNQLVVQPADGAALPGDHDGREDDADLPTVTGTSTTSRVA